MIGRNVLYPGADDPRAVAAAVSAIVHEGSGGADVALAAMGRGARQGTPAHASPDRAHRE